MLYTDENGITKQLKPREKMPGINDRNREYWKKRSMTWYKEKIFFDAPIKTGECYFCKKEGRAQKSRRTALHHVKYNNDDPLEWTIEVCNSCHYQIDLANKKIIDRRYAPRKFARYVDREAERIADYQQFRELYPKRIERLRRQYRL